MNVLQGLTITEAGRTLFGLRKLNQATLDRRIGNASAYGSVHSLNVDGFLTGAFVLKQMQFKHEEDSHIFDNEIAVGNNAQLFLQGVGPVIVAYKKTATYGVYVMNSFTGGVPWLKSESLDAHIRRIRACPDSRSVLYSLLTETLLKFYKVTKGYHGDLHPGNIALITDNSGSVWRLYVFDYGAHRRFHSKNTQHCESLGQVFDAVKRNFNKNWTRANQKGYFPENSPVRTVYPERGQPYRANNELLKYYSENLFKHLASPRSVAQSPSVSSSEGSRKRTRTNRNANGTQYFTARS